MRSNGNKVEAQVADAELVQRRQREIAEAALRRFAVAGFHGTTIKSIAAEAGIAVGSVYDYIRRKEDLLDLIYDLVMSDVQLEMKEAVEEAADPQQRLRALIYVNLSVLDRMHDFFLLMYRESGNLRQDSLEHVQRKENDYIDLYRDCLREGVKSGTFRQLDVDAHAVLIAFSCSVWTLKRWNLGELDLDSTAAIIGDLALSGIKD